MGDIGDLWRDVGPAWKERSQQKRASNRARSAAILTERGISFESKNDGAHLIVTSPVGIVFDFWPGTGLWQRRGHAKRSRGIRSLFKALEAA